MANSVSISSPKNGASVSKTVAVAVKTTGPPPTVSLYIDGVKVAYSPSNTWSYSWDTTKWADGAHTLRADAVYRNGDTASSSVGVMVANPLAPFTVAIAGNPTDGSILTATITGG